MERKNISEIKVEANNLLKVRRVSIAQAESDLIVSCSDGAKSLMLILRKCFHVSGK
jgi:hypothetical protein